MGVVHRRRRQPTIAGSKSATLASDEMMDRRAAPADHRIAAIGGVGFGGAHGGDGAQDRFADLGLAEVARQYAVAARHDRSDLGELADGCQIGRRVKARPRQPG